jgi:uncharacterized protein (TIGR02118 family)
MINAITLLKRRPDLSSKEFRDYWRTRHADVIAKLPGVERYVQSHPLDGESPYDGFAELWAKDSQAFRNIGSSDAYVDVQADEENFLDRKANVLVLTDEHVIIDGNTGEEAIKCIRFFNRRPDMSVDEFQAHWREQHAPLVAALPSLSRYVHYPARAGGYAKGRQPAYDGFDMAWFDSLEALREAMSSAAYQRVRDDQGSFLAAGDCPQIVAREYLFIG